jgi:hypothetical protein
MIRIPEEYANTIHSRSRVIIISQDIREDSIIPTARAGTLSPDDFTELKIDTRNFKFDRED